MKIASLANSARLALYWAGWSPVSRRTSTLVSTATTPFPADVLLQCLHDLRIGHRLDPRFEHARNIGQRRRREGRLGLEQNAVVGVDHLQFKEIGRASCRERVCQYV